MIKNKTSQVSLDSLSMFSRAAVALNFTRAAAELGVTQAAVSRRIISLEQQLGTTLFNRESNRKLTLTSHGEKLYQAVNTSLSLINSVIDEISRAKNSDTVSLTTTSGFATLWLMHRLSEFNSQHPEIKVRVVMVDELVNLYSESIDIGIRYGEGGWAGVESELLFGEYVYPVCSPQYLTDNPRIKDINQLAELDLLHIEERVPTVANWHQWFTAVGVEIGRPKSKLTYNNYPLLVQSSIDGLGVVLGWHHMIYASVQNKELVRPVSQLLKTNVGFHMIRQQGQMLTANTQLLYDWILERAKFQNDPV